MIDHVHQCDEEHILLSAYVGQDLQGLDYLMIPADHYFFVISSVLFFYFIFESSAVIKLIVFPMKSAKRHILKPLIYNVSINLKF